MFTGIIEASAQIIEKSDSGIIVQRPEIFTNLQIGQSIAINGACLSIVKCNENTMRFDVVPETFQKTNLKAVTKVNLERAIPVNGRLEGHIVLGHVDTTTKLIKKKQEDGGVRHIFSLPRGLRDFCILKGSIAINGVSLTIASVDKSDTGQQASNSQDKPHNCDQTFGVALIPHTLENTNLGELKIGDEVNIEADYFAKLLKKWYST